MEVGPQGAAIEGQGAGRGSRLTGRLISAAAISVAVIALFAPLFTGQSLFRRDLLRFVFPNKDYLRERLLAGELPLWTPLIGLGRPFLGTVQPAVLYPLNLLLLPLPPVGSNLFLGAHILIMMFGMRAWLRRLAISEESALLGALTLGLSGYVVGMLTENGAYMVGVAWIPWALAQTAALDGDGHKIAGAAARFGLALALCVLAGDPQAAWFAGIVGVAQALGQGDRRAVLCSLAAVAGGALLGGALAAAQLVPALEAAAAGRPHGIAAGEEHFFALSPLRIPEFEWSLLYGDPLHFGHWFATALTPETRTPPLVNSIYLGVATPWFGLAALAARQRRRLYLALGATGLGALLLALGYHTPVHHLFFNWVPGAGLFRHPEKYLFVTTLCAAALAARGLDAAAGALRPTALIGGAMLVVLTAAAIAARAAGPAIARHLLGTLDVVPADEAGTVFAQRTLFALGIGACCLMPLLLAAVGAIRPRWAVLALAAVAAVDMLAAAVRQVDWTPNEVMRQRSPVLDDLFRAAGPSPVPPRLFRPDVDILMLGGPPAQTPIMTLLPNCGLSAGVNHLAAYDFFRTPAEQALWSALEGRDLLRLLQLTATPFLFLDDLHLGPPPPMLRLLHRYAGIRAALYEVRGAAPRVYLAAHTSAVQGTDAAVRAVAATGFRPGIDAVVEGGEARDTEGRCDIERYAPEAVRLRCDATAPGYAILADTPLPGWRARIDGRPAPVLVGNAVMRAIPVPAGHATIELTYRPPRFAAGVAVSLGGLVVAAGLALGGRRRRPAAPPRPGQQG